MRKSEILTHEDRFWIAVGKTSILLHFSKLILLLEKSVPTPPAIGLGSSFAISAIIWAVSLGFFIASFCHALPAAFSAIIVLKTSVMEWRNKKNKH